MAHDDSDPPAGAADAVTAPLPDELLSDSAVGGRVVRGGAVRVVGFVVANGLAAVGTILLLRHLGVDDFGRYGTVMALMSILIGVTDAGLTQIGVRELSLVEANTETRLTTASILGIRLVLTVLGVLATLAFAVVAGYDDAMVAGVAVAGVGVVGIAAASAMSLPAIVGLRNVALSIVEVLKAAIQVVGIAICVVLGATLLPFFGVQAAVGLGILLLLPLVLGRGTLVRPSYDRERWRYVVTAALPVAIAGVLGVLYLRVIVVLSSLIAGVTQTGLMATSSRIVEVATGLPLLFTGVVLPVAAVAARDDPVRLRHIAQRTLEVGLLLGIALALMFGFGAPILVDILGGSRFEDAVPVLTIQGLVIISVFLVQACVVVLIVTHRQSDIVRANVIGLIGILVLGVAGLELDGARGGAIAVVAADLLLTTVMLVMVKRAGVSVVPGLAPRILAAAGIAVIGGLLVGGSGLLATVVALVLLGVFSLLFRAVPSEILDAVPKRA